MCLLITVQATPLKAIDVVHKTVWQIFDGLNTAGSESPQGPAPSLLVPPKPPHRIWVQQYGPSFHNNSHISSDQSLILRRRPIPASRMDITGD